LIAGDTIVTAGRTIGEGDITLFAGLAGDFTPIHVDEAFARSTPFGERIAHGPLTLSVAVGLLTQTGFLGERVVGLVNLNWDFAGPVRIGDTIRAQVKVEEVRPTSKPDRNLATFLFEVTNQRGETVQSGRLRVIVKAD
jgi:acyl dehydratase